MYNRLSRAASLRLNSRHVRYPEVTEEQDETLNWSQAKRPESIGPPRARILIVCEGRETEPRYFDALCRHKRLTATEVEIHGDPSGSHPGNLVDYAARNAAREAERLGLETNPYDRVWCVFDRDNHENIHDVLAKAASLGFKVALSNPCFEVWFLLHFKYSSAELTPREAAARLRVHIDDYEKSADLYDILLERRAQAILNSRRLREYHIRARDKPLKNPATTVDRLVLELGHVAAGLPLDADPVPAYAKRPVLP